MSAIDRRLGSSERRGAPRRPVTFAVRQGTGARARLALAIDLSPDGLALARADGEAALSPGELVEVAFGLAGDGAPVAARARVVHDGAAGRVRRAGLRFEALSPDDAARIARHVVPEPA